MRDNGKELPAFWQVQCVWDDKGDGGDFAYSIGLHTRGLPELHVSARPTDGEDPGLDWFFNPEENGLLVNEFARLLLRGQVRSGTRIEREFDGGHTTVTFFFGEPVAPTEVEALGANPAARVIPVSWSLHRTPPGPRTPLTESALQALRREVWQLQGSLDARALAELPRRWRPPALASPDQIQALPDDALGPNAVLVRTRCAQLLMLDRRRLEVLVEKALHAYPGFGPTRVLAETAALARPVGRAEVWAACRDLAEDVAGAVTRTTRRWREVVRFFAGSETGGREREHLAHHLEDLLRLTFAATLTLDAMRDVIGSDTRRAGYGPLRWALHDGPGAPGPEYQLPPGAGAHHALRALIGPLDRADLRSLGRLGRVLESAQHEDRSDLLEKVRSLRVTDPVTPAPLTELLADTPAAKLIDGLGLEALTELTDAVSVLAVLLASAEVFQPSERAVLTAHFSPLFPGLDEVVDNEQSARAESALPVC